MNTEETLQKTPLFKNIKREDVKDVIGALGAKERSYAAGENILREGEKVRCAGVIAEGGAVIESVDFFGNVTLVQSLSACSVFAEAYALRSDVPLAVSVTATDKTHVIFLNISAVLGDNCPEIVIKSGFLKNLLTVCASKNLQLSEKILHTGHKTLRGKIISYLSAESKKNGSETFCIPFDRRRLADYLNADRSALSFELSKMKKEGMIDYHKNSFRILKDYPER